MAGTQTIGGVKTFSSTISGSIDGNADTVTDGVTMAGTQTIGGVKTFSSTISGSIDGTANKIQNDTIDNTSGTGTVGVVGEIRYDSNYIYICLANGTNNWKRVVLDTFL